MCVNVFIYILRYLEKKRIKMKKVSFYSQTYEQTSFFLLNLLIQFTAPHAHAHTHICVCVRARARSRTLFLESLHRLRVYITRNRCIYIHYIYIIHTHGWL